MKRIAPPARSCLLCICLVLIGFSVAIAAEKPPNIVFILADDSGLGEFGCYGGTAIPTPNVNRLAREGLLFSNAYSGSAVCAPTRCVLMTGQHPGHGLRRANQSKIGLLALAAGTPTVARLLHAAGYATGGFGKWGLGNEGTTGAAEQQGFDLFYGYYDQVHAHSYFPDDLTRNGVREKLPGNRDGKGTQYSHDLIEAETLRFIEASAKTGKPFFCYAAWTLPHGKFEIPSYAQFADRPWPEPVKIHAAMIARLDTGVGKILAKLRELGLERNTLVIFTSDNGAEGPGRQTFNATAGLRGYKRHLYEGGIRAPFIARWPGTIAAGRTSDLLTSHVDLMATAAELARVKAPRNDGISIVPALLGRAQTVTHEALYWEIYEGPSPFQQAVRWGRWKGYRTGMKAPLELYDLERDRAEATNVAAQHPAEVKAIEAIMAREHVPSPHYDALEQPGAKKGSGKQKAPAKFEFQNPVRPGDYPDPSVIRVGADYWATATSSEWAPHFPLLHSRDLVNWEVKGRVLATTPGWAKGSFWAPEIAEDKGKFFVYYTARRHDNRLAVAVATADRAAGPYTDHGELVAQEAGSIDAVPFTDAHGVRWLLWKEDGNSRKLPTPIWMQRLSDDGLRLVGERREILRNDAKWEGAVVEGPFVVRRGDFYYLFYSGGACCGRGCDYALGVARAKDMLGPWEKCPANPILAGNDAWRCPGHGSIVADPDGKYWLLYHAYAQKGFVATGREMLLDEVVFGADGWASINGGRGPSSRARGPGAAKNQYDLTHFREEFDGGGELPPGWQWLIGGKPTAVLAGGALTLTATDGPAAVVQSIVAPSFVVETAVEARQLTGGALGGIAIYGDRVNHLALVTDGKTTQVWSQRRGERTVVAERATPAGESVILRIACIDGSRFRFAVQDGSGRWAEIAGETDGSYLPPWDRGVRAGLYAAGTEGAAGTFAYFSFTPDDGKLFAK